MRELHVFQHLNIDIHVAIEHCLKQDSPGVLTDLKFKKYDRAIIHLRELIQNGYDYVVASGCDNYEYNGRCKGHETWVDPYAGQTAQEATGNLSRTLSLINGKDYLI